ncbi:hypothetical protein M433DRAFT_160950 [Acidomyces richmondensis BFW]|nr:hypothetical protein M433DRAFT_160950 [Acidomyces richmondensis BFW]
MSRHNIEATIFGLFSQIVVDLPGLAPIWESGRSFLCSASFDILLATAASRTFASVLSRAIGLYAPAFV